MAQALEDFELRIEDPLRALSIAEPERRDIASIVEQCDNVKRTFRKKLQTLASDAADLVPRDIEINALELVRRSA
jgi:hypothetical protein